MSDSESGLNDKLVSDIVSVLSACWVKLKWYSEHHQEYVGGEEYSHLKKRIESLLKQLGN